MARLRLGLTQKEAQTNSNPASTSLPLSFRGNNTGNGSADFFIELDALSKVKLSKNGAQSSPIPVGQTSGRLLASCAFSSFDAGSTATVNAWLDGYQLILGGPDGVIHGIEQEIMHGDCQKIIVASPGIYPLDGACC